MNKIKMLAVLNFITLVIQISVSFLVQRKLINDLDVGEVSDQYPSLFTPAGGTFAIWGLIYFLLVVFCIYHLYLAWHQREMHSANVDVQRIGWWFIVNNLATTAWLMAWVNNNILVSLVLIVVQLIALVAIHVNLGIYDTGRTWRSKIGTQFPLSIYLAWITVATIANTAIYLLSIGWTGWGITPAAWTIIMVGITVFISFLVIIGRRNFFFGLVIIWALYGIIAARKAEDSMANISIIKITWVAIGVIMVACLLRLIRNLLSKTPPSKQRTFPIAPNH